MKICILTQPLGDNYGGLLQNYALQIALRRMGHDVWTEDRQRSRRTLKNRLQHNKYLRMLLGKKPLPKLYEPTAIELSVLRKHTNQFICKNIQTTVPVYGIDKTDLLQYNFDAYVVGSDQVWRPSYSWGIFNYFLDFTHTQNVKRIAYAASFGVDSWEYTEEQTKRCIKLISKFDAVSIRENSGVDLCKKYLHREDVLHVIDPTMLLSKQDYCDLYLKEQTPSSEGNLLVYILDANNKKSAIIQTVSDVKGLKEFKVMPTKKFKDVGSEYLSDCIFPSVTHWLRGFSDAEFVVTDSFHGCVFSLIFEKPFFVILNKERGSARFSSLLSTFGLTHRIVSSVENVTEEKLNEKINWEAIADIKQEKIKEALEFLEKGLKSN